MLVCDGIPFCDFSLLPVRLQQLDYEKGTLELDGAYIDFIDSSEAQVSVKFGNEYHDLVLNQRYSMTKYFGVTAFRMKTFHVSVPVPPSGKERLLQFVLRSHGYEYVLDYAFLPMAAALQRISATHTGGSANTCLSGGKTASMSSNQKN